MDLKQLIDLTKKHWHQKIGLFFAILLSMVLAHFIIKSIDLSGIIGCLIYILFAMFVILTWFHSNKIPKTKKGKVGFVVSIQTSNDDEEKIIKEDFILTLRTLLKNSPTGSSFHFIELPQHLSKNVNDIDDALVLRATTKCHFLIFGRVRLRTINKKDCYVLDLNGAVNHKPLPKEIQKNFTREFTELFPKNLQISSENNLLSFNFTSEWTECVAKYIIGIASAFSFNFDYSEALFKEVQSKLSSKKTDFPVFGKLKERIPIRLSEINLLRATSSFDKWRKSHADEHLQQFVSFLAQISEEYYDDYQILLLRGIEAFLNGRRVDEAIQITKKCKQYDDPIWHFNLAFLYSYKKDLVKSIRNYRIAANYELEGHTIDEVESFLVKILEDEPEKYQLHFCLGFFNMEIKGDFKQAEIDLNRFLNYEDDNFQKEKELARQWLNNIKTSQKDNSNSTF
jgi:tetratricopeptide (TPR) repeat protein